MQNNPAGGNGGSGANGQAPAHVLVVDDDPTVAEVVAGYLDRAGHDVARAADGPSALARFARRRPDLVVLDLMLPGMDGFEVCRRMRELGGRVPVIMLTARGDEEDRVLGLETGADDYVTKPFSPRELVLRVESVLRRARLPVPAPGTSPTTGVLRTATLSLDPAARRATRDGAELALTLREFDLLSFFLRHPGRAFSREELMSEVWGWDFGDLSTVTVHVRRLRAKIEHDPARPRLIQTVWGVGYRLAEPGDADESAATGRPPPATRAAHGAVGVPDTRPTHGAERVPDAPAGTSASSRDTPDTPRRSPDPAQAQAPDPAPAPGARRSSRS
ncbi:response regulator transcription factor [Streptomyces niveus]|uniref:response regulator transcription factor n=1 Tax=Streptomyces niveus TaxID=193462 RepID=UPI00362ADD54